MILNPCKQLIFFNQNQISSAISFSPGLKKATIQHTFIVRGCVKLVSLYIYRNTKENSTPPNISSLLCIVHIINMNIETMFLIG